MPFLLNYLVLEGILLGLRKLQNTTIDLRSFERLYYLFKSTFLPF
jgi:hypothetical protein